MDQFETKVKPSFHYVGTGEPNLGLLASRSPGLWGGNSRGSSAGRRRNWLASASRVRELKLRTTTPSIYVKKRKVWDSLEHSIDWHRLSIPFLLRVTSRGMKLKACRHHVWREFVMFQHGKYSRIRGQMKKSFRCRRVFYSVVFGFTWLSLQGFIALPFPTAAGSLDFAQVAPLPRTQRGVFPFPFPPSPTSGAGQTHRSRATPAGTLFSLVTYWRARQGTSSSAPRDPSPTAAVDHAAAASRTPDLNARLGVVSPASRPSPKLRAAYLTWSPRSFPLRVFPCFGPREFLLQASSPPSESSPPPSSGAGASHPPPPPGSSRPSPRRPRGGPSCPAGARCAARSTTGRRPRSSVTLPPALLPAKTLFSRGSACAESLCPWSFELPFQVANKKKMHLDFPRSPLRF